MSILPRFRAAGACVAAVALVFVLAYRAIGGPFFPNDDAYIALHNAHVLRLGYDPVYRGVPALVGATSLIHLVLLTFLELFVTPPALALFVLCAIVAILYVLIIFTMGLDAGWRPSRAALLALASLLIGGSFFQFLNGLDTGLAMAAVACDLILLSSPRRRTAAAILAGLLPFIRPELGVLTLGAIFVLLCDTKTTTRRRIALCALAAAAALPFLVWARIDTGSWWPTTIDAKEYFFAETQLAFAVKMAGMMRTLTPVGLAITPLIFCVAFIRPRALRLLCLFFGAAVLTAYFRDLPLLVYVNADRYFFIFAPIVIYGIICGLSASTRGRRLTAAALLMGGIAPTLLAIRAQYLSYAYFMNTYRPNLVAVVEWANLHLPPDSIVMIHDAGYISEAGRFPLVDLVGLKTPAAIDWHRRVTFPSGGARRSQAIADIADTCRPQYLLAAEAWVGGFKLLDGLRADDWRVSQVYQSPLYEIYALTKTSFPRPAVASAEKTRQH